MAICTLSVSRPRSPRRRLVASSPLPSAETCPKRAKAHQGNHKGKTRKAAPISCSSSADDMKKGVGRNSDCSAPPAPSSSVYALLSPSRFLRSHADASPFLSRGWGQPPTSVVEVRDRPAAALVGEAEAPDLEPAFTSPCLSQRLHPQGFLLEFPERAPLEEMLPRLGPAKASQTLSSRLLLRPREVLSSDNGPPSTGRTSQRAARWRLRPKSGFWRGSQSRLYRYSFAVTLDSVHVFASRHLTSVIEHFRRAAIWETPAFALAGRRTAQIGDVPRRDRLARLLPASPIRLPFHSPAPPCGQGAGGVRSRPRPSPGDGCNVLSGLG